MQNNRDLSKHFEVKITHVTKKNFSLGSFDKKIFLSSFLSVDTFQSPLVPLIVHCPKTGLMGTIQTNKFIPNNLSYL